MIGKLVREKNRVSDQTWDIKEGEGCVSVNEADEAVAEREGATRAALLAAAMQVSSRTNRRKPAAPQYIRPEDSPDNLPEKPEAEDDPDPTINGVCVMNQSLSKNGESNGEEDQGSPEAATQVEGTES